MKTSDSKKGLLPDKSVIKEINDIWDDPEYLASLAEDGPSDEYLEEKNRLITLELEEKAKKEKKWEEQGVVNYEILREKQKSEQQNGTNYIGERIAFLREVSDMQPAEVYGSAGIAKTTLFRIERGENVPTQKVILKILYALSTTLADFSCFPNDFDEWKKAITETSGSENIYRFRDEVLNKLENSNFSYKVGGKDVRFSRLHLLALKRMIEASFTVLDLQQHDKEQ